MRRKVERRGLAAIAFGVLTLALLGPQAASAGGTAHSMAAAPSTLSGANQSQPTDRIIIKYRGGVMGVAASSTAGQRATLHQSAQDVALRSGMQLKLVRLGAFDTHIMKLRQKVEDDPGNPVHILTVYGEGYRFID